MNKYTGERIESFIYNESTVEHLHRYAIACELTKNKFVLDIACGEGYGSNLLAEHSKEVIGVDINKTTIRQAKKKYKKKNLRFLEGDVESIPCEKESVDVIVSFETLEHVIEQDKMLKEFKRVLKSDGVVIISTPDKKVYSEIPAFKNSFHVKELYAEEFYQMMQHYFRQTIFLKQNSFFSSVMIPQKESKNVKYYEGNFDKLCLSATLQPLYHICIASDLSVDHLPPSIFFSSQTWDLAMRERLRSSISYRTGNFILWPLKKIYSVFKK